MMDDGRVEKFSAQRFFVVAVERVDAHTLRITGDSGGMRLAFQHRRELAGGDILTPEAFDDLERQYRARIGEH